jgi:hypothetical protein
MRKLLLLATVSALVFGAEATPAKRGRLLLEDEFNGPSLATGWRQTKGKWTLADGKLRGVELAADHHAAVVRRPVRYQDAVIETSFRLDAGAKMAALSINTTGGHLCRVILRPSGITVQKDKKNKDATDPVAVLATRPMKLTPGQWYRLTVHLRGTSMTAQIDDGVAFGGEHPALTAEKVDVGLPVSGEGAAFDYLRVWEAK